VRRVANRERRERGVKGMQTGSRAYLKRAGAPAASSVACWLLGPGREFSLATVIRSYVGDPRSFDTHFPPPECALRAPT